MGCSFRRTLNSTDHRARVSENRKITSLQHISEDSILGPWQCWPTLNVLCLATHGFLLARPSEDARNVLLHTASYISYTKMLSFQLKNYIMKCIYLTFLLLLQYRSILRGCLHFGPFMIHIP